MMPSANRTDELATAEGPGELWREITEHGERVARTERALSGLLERHVLRHRCLPAALADILARKLSEDDVPAGELELLFGDVMRGDPGIAASAVADLLAIRDRDPASANLLDPFLNYKGFQALQAHRIAHALWQAGRCEMARYLQSRASEVFAVDIHPAVPVGRGVFIDHATGLVVGETAVIGNDVSILQGVTLGGTGKETGDRHPKVRDGVLLAAGAKILGNIEIGRGAKVGAGSVVLSPVPPCATVAGVPARIVGWCRDMIPALAMDQSLPKPPG